MAAIDMNSLLSDIDKFNYLCSFLQGPVLKAIAGLTLIAANYQEAIEMLQKRFVNRQCISGRSRVVFMVFSLAQPC